jgi:cathepsin A (carboxypeptidase C)
MEFCSLLMDTILGNPLAPKFNVYDIRKKCDKPPLCYDMSASDKYLNTPSVQKTLGVTGRKWVECAKAPHMALLGDWIKNMSPKITNVLEQGLQVLVYSGDKDFVCNWRGGESWTHALKWTGQADFQAAAYHDWMVEGEAAGSVKSFKNFQFLRVYNAGHMVPMDQPKNALHMLQAFILNEIHEEEPTTETFTQ